MDARHSERVHALKGSIYLLCWFLRCLTHLTQAPWVLGRRPRSCVRCGGKRPAGSLWVLRWASLIMSFEWGPHLIVGFLWVGCEGWERCAAFPPVAAPPLLFWSLASAIIIILVRACNYLALDVFKELDFVCPVQSLLPVITLAFYDLPCYVCYFVDQKGCGLRNIEGVLMPVQLTKNGAVLQHQHCLLPLSSILQVQ